VVEVSQKASPEMHWPVKLEVWRWARRKAKQESLWVMTEEIARTDGHPFYRKVNEILEQHQVDRRLEHLCRRFYKPVFGRPSLAPGVYFRMLLIGFFEGMGSERGIAWQVADSLSLREFIGWVAA
jgi:hypothetical protein